MWGLQIPLLSCRNLGKATELPARGGKVGSGTALGLSWPLCETLVFERLLSAEALLQTILLRQGDALETINQF